MSRVLAQLLGANQVPFRQQVQRLEQAAGLPSADIRLATHIMEATRQKYVSLALILQIRPALNCTLRCKHDWYKTKCVYELRLIYGQISTL
ncbi:hypothetical protein IPL68_07900 [Candidatus Saccharibacteria bacterium]|nr:MAG: hypothetical protein IPL68_07900 [Candidatus Saccharibacteria bacterium]